MEQTEYQALSDVRKTLRVDWYQRPNIYFVGLLIRPS